MVSSCESSFSVNAIKYFSYHDGLECLADTVMECVYPEKLLEIYHITEMIVYSSGVCAERALMCSPSAAIECISSLSQLVTHYNPVEDDPEKICRYVVHSISI